jgi:membrane associated rhomboid family serine protease
LSSFSSNYHCRRRRWSRSFTCSVSCLCVLHTPHWAMRVGFPVNDYWPFLTHQFLHGGWLHIIGNMWTLWIFGDNVEDRMGSLRFAIFYLRCGFVAAMTDLMTQWDRCACRIYTRAGSAFNPATSPPDCSLFQTWACLAGNGSRVAGILTMRLFEYCAA